MRANSLVFTANNRVKREFVDSVKDRYSSVVYIIAADEVAPTTGTPHVQGWVHFTHPIGIASFKKKLNCYADARKGTVAEADAYCRKEDPMPIVEGDRPMDNQQGNRTDYQTIAKMVRDGERLEAIFDAFPSQFLLHQRHIRDLRNFLRRPEHLQGPPEVILYRGPPGHGKSTAIERRIGNRDFYTPIQDPGDGKLWFDGYDGEEIIWLRDFNGGALTLIKNLLDKWTVRLPIKGGSVLARPRTIFICSNKDPSFWYPDVQPDQLDALERRITEWYVPGTGLHEFRLKDEYYNIPETPDE